MDRSGGLPQILLFCFIAILNTTLMATADRRRDLAALRIALRRLSGDGFISAPYLLIAGAAVSGLLALIGTVVPVGAARRGVPGPVHPVSASE
jgi:putative ABC transport system permease protein